MFLSAFFWKAWPLNSRGPRLCLEGPGLLWSFPSQPTYSINTLYGEGNVKLICIGWVVCVHLAQAIVKNSYVKE